MCNLLGGGILYMKILQHVSVYVLIDSCDVECHG